MAKERPKTVEATPRLQNGIVAILDAIGAANYTEGEVQRFLQSRSVVLELLGKKVEDVFGTIEARNVATFTFNDTVVLILRCDRNGPKLDDMAAFFGILRKFLVDSMEHRILFRGAVSVGSFYLIQETNTVMGDAVTDAAAWYEKADWIGVHATPHATIVIQRWLEQEPIDKMANLMLEYEVPVKEGKSVRVKTVNWPRAFFVKSLTPCRGGEKPREKLLELLAVHPIPRGTEGKYYNTIAFFDYSVEERERMQTGF